MEAATNEHQEAEPQKLKIDKFADGHTQCLRFEGAIDEDFDGKKLAQSVKAKTLVLDLANINKISSFGIREWVDFIRGVEKQTEEIILLECAPKVVDQLNMVANFAGDGKVFSFYAPYRCDYCDSDGRVLMQVDKDYEVIKSMNPPERTCASCGETEYFDEDPASYFLYVAGQDQFELEPDVAAFLSAKLNYVVSDAARRLRVDKFIEGRSTYIGLSGDLDGAFPRDKLGEGLEGIVVLDVSGIGKIEPAGAAEWRTFMQMVTPSVEAMYLLGCPPAFLERLTKPEDLGPKAQVISFAMPYSCDKCATTASQQVDVEQHYDVLKFATPPEMKCGDCPEPTVCAASEGLLSHLPTLPKPEITPQTRKFIKQAKDRKPAKKAAAAGAEISPRTGGGAGTALVAALVAAVLAIGGVVVYDMVQKRRLIESARQRDEVGTKIEASAAKRPAWLTSDTRFSNYCTENAAGLSCVGVSSYTSNVPDARVEATEAALEGMAHHVGLKIKDKEWARTVRKLYGDTRDAKLGAFDKARTDPDGATYDRARREVMEGRRAVAEALKKTSGGAVPSQPSAEYWEQYASTASDGSSRFLMFIRFEITKANVSRLVEQYGKPETALGASAVTLFPGVAWRYPDVTTGAIVTDLESGDLRALGLAEKFIVMSIQSREVTDAKVFATMITEEVERAKKEGGNIQIIVKTGDTLPVEFNKPIPKRETARPAGRGNRGNRNPGAFRGNTWEQTGGKQNRENPFD